MFLHIGFTGTRDGMTDKQRSECRMLLKHLAKTADTVWFHHGDCVGSDAEAHLLALHLKYRIEVHPPKLKTLRAFCGNYDRIHSPRDYMVRNRAIVMACSVLIATPKTVVDDQRSGAWATIKFAQSLRKKVHILSP